MTPGVIASPPVATGGMTPGVIASPPAPTGLYGVGAVYDAAGDPLAPEAAWAALCPARPGEAYAACFDSSGCPLTPLATAYPPPPGGGGHAAGNTRPEAWGEDKDYDPKGGKGGKGDEDEGLEDDAGATSAAAGAILAAAGGVSPDNMGEAQVFPEGSLDFVAFNDGSCSSNRVFLGWAAIVQPAIQNGPARMWFHETQPDCPVYWIELGNRIGNEKREFTPGMAEMAGVLTSLRGLLHLLCSPELSASSEGILARKVPKTERDPRRVLQFVG